MAIVRSLLRKDKLSMKKYVFRWRRRRTEAFETDVGLNPSTWHQPHFSLLQRGRHSAAHCAWPLWGCSHLRHVVKGLADAGCVPRAGGAAGLRPTGSLTSQNSSLGDCPGSDRCGDSIHAVSGTLAVPGRRGWRPEYVVISIFIQFRSIQLLSCVWRCNPMNCSTPGFPVHHQLPELAQTHVRQVSDAIQPSHPLSSPSPPAVNRSQHQGLFK